MKKTLLILLSLLLLCLCACGETRVCTSEFAPQSGSYVAKAKWGSVIAAKLTVDLDELTFDFYYDSLSSYWAVGNIEPEENGYLLKCSTNDGLYTYNFRITKADTIVFVAEGSSPIEMIQGEPSVVDGTEFKLEK